MGLIELVMVSHAVVRSLVRDPIFFYAAASGTHSEIYLFMRFIMISIRFNFVRFNEVCRVFWIRFAEGDGRDKKKMRREKKAEKSESR